MAAVTLPPFPSQSALVEYQALSSVPPQYVRPLDERPIVSQQPSSVPQKIPIIDIAQIDGFHRDSVVQKIKHACEEWGFFQVTNHGIPNELLDRVRDVSRQFFDLPMEEKKQHAMKPGTLQGFGQQIVHSDTQVLDWGHLFSLVHSPFFMASGNLWPSKPAEFRETMETFSKGLEKVAQRLLKLVSESLGLQENYFIDAYGEHVSQAMRINYYPPCPQPDLVLGLTAHSDASGITLLLQDGTEGLQVRKDGEWVQVEAVVNALVINIGDQLEVMSNGRYKSVEHRAVTNERKSRLSWATFYNPSWEAMIFPAPQLIDESHPALYNKFKSADYMFRLFNSKLEGKKLVESVKSKPGEENI